MGIFSDSDVDPENYGGRAWPPCPPLQSGMLEDKWILKAYDDDQKQKNKNKKMDKCIFNN